MHSRIPGELSLYELKRKREGNSTVNYHPAFEYIVDGSLRRETSQNYRLAKEILPLCGSAEIHRSKGRTPHYGVRYVWKKLKTKIMGKSMTHRFSFLGESTCMSSPQVSFDMKVKVARPISMISTSTSFFLSIFRPFTRVPLVLPQS